MKKIIGIISPISFQQKLYILDDNGEILEQKDSKARNLIDDILKTTEQYKINNIDLKGNLKYATGIVKQIQEKEMTKYGQNKLNIVIMKK